MTDFMLLSNYVQKVSLAALLFLIHCVSCVLYMSNTAMSGQLSYTWDNSLGIPNPSSIPKWGPTWPNWSPTWAHMECCLGGQLPTGRTIYTRTNYLHITTIPLDNNHSISLNRITIPSTSTSLERSKTSIKYIRNFH